MKAKILINIFKKPTVTDLKLYERNARSRCRLRQQAFDYQEFVKRNQAQKANSEVNHD